MGAEALFSHSKVRAMRQWLEALSHPEQKFEFLRIAGTNGKGSVGAVIARGLFLAGRGPVGHFSSPHVLNYRERMQVDGQWISAEQMRTVDRRLEEVKKEKSLPEMSYFARSFLQALLFFEQSGCRFAVVECGIGAREDVTQCLWECTTHAVVTTIARDHEKTLGHRLPEIAFHKAAVLPPGGEAHSAFATAEVRRVLVEQAHTFRTRLHFFQPEDAQLLRVDCTCERPHQFFAAQGHTWESVLVGRHQVENAVLAIRSLKDLGVSDADIQKALQTVVWRGRMERIHQNPDVWIDGAHNDQAIARLRDNLEWLSIEHPFLVFGAHRDKISQAAQEALYRVGTVCPISIQDQTDEQIAHAVEKALTTCIKNDRRRPIVVCGSLYSLGAAIRYFS